MHSFCTPSGLKDDVFDLFFAPNDARLSIGDGRRLYSWGFVRDLDRVCARVGAAILELLSHSNYGLLPDFYTSDAVSDCPRCGVYAGLIMFLVHLSNSR